ncbi:uncharacterized protein [Aquarana catesbeiana]|uniref:uncharacterized protein isoform X3 n=1 Tax=Aquarana catesbeiana TaxID=8400 RepID=UPI003CC969D7
MVTLPTIMVSRTHKFCSYLLHVLLILYQVQTSLEETFTNETSTNINSAEQVSFYGTTEVIPFTINTTAETGGASHPEPSVYNASSDPDLSFSTGGENPVITNTTADPGGASYPETSVYNASAGPDLFLPTREELPGIGNATAETIGAFHPDPSMYTASAGPDLSFPTEKKNPVTTNPTTETGGVSHPESDNSTELGSLYPTGGGITVTTSPMEETTGGASHPDMISCLRDTDCPPFSSCTSGPGPRICHCHLGLYFHPHLGCVTARTFPARLAISAFHSTDGTIRGDGQLETTISREVTKLFGAVFGNVWGYLSTSVTVLQPSEGHMTIVHSFSMLHEITEEDLREELTVSALRCEEGNGSCISLLATDVYQSLSLCDFALCDSSSSDCQSHAGLVTCKCQNGYFKFDPSDRSCRACESGFWRTEGQCQRCPLGYGGFNCQEAFLLVVIALSCVVSVLLVSLVTVLFYYFRKKKKPKPTFMDSLVLGVSTDQPVLRLPRAQFSWRREWEWTDQSGKILEDLHREGTVLNQNSEPSDIQMRTFGSISRTSVPNFNRGSHNLAFISDN